MTQPFARSLVALAAGGLWLLPVAPADAQDAAPARISTKNGDISFSRQQITCRAAGTGESRELGAILAGPQAETLWDQVVRLT